MGEKEARAGNLGVRQKYGEATIGERMGIQVS